MNPERPGEWRLSPPKPPIEPLDVYTTPAGEVWFLHPTPVIKIRVAVAVDARGKWSASGWSGATDAEMMSNACDFVEADEARYWLEVEVPLPFATTLTPTLEADATGGAAAHR